MCLGLAAGYIKPAENTPKMTIQECYDRVIAQYNIYVNNHDSGTDSELAEELRLSAEALKKQIPMTPTLEGDGYDDNGALIYDTWYCPNCNSSYEVDYDNYDFCPNCGQAILFKEAPCENKTK